MAWHRTGTVSVTASSTTVTGSGTAFVANARVGDAFIGPDGRLYEISNVASDTAISILPAYIGSSASGQGYAIAPVQGYVKKLADEASELLNEYGAVGTAAFEDAVTSASDTTSGRLLKVGALRAQLGADVYGRSNIVGTVSQSGGVPTGAIFQRGSNPNGEFVRFADGTMISWGVLEKSLLVSPNNLNIVVQGITIYRSSDSIRAFPIAFITPPALSFSPVSTGVGGTSPQPLWGKISGGSISTFTLQLHGLYGWQNDGIDYERLQNVQFVAIGRWFN